MGGHNAGIVSEPGHHGRHYVMATRNRGERYIDSDTWLTRAAPGDSSWWPAWMAWLEARSDREHVSAPPLAGSCRFARRPALWIVIGDLT